MISTGIPMLWRHIGVCHVLQCLTLKKKATHIAALRLWKNAYYVNKWSFFVYGRRWQGSVQSGRHRFHQLLKPQFDGGSPRVWWPVSSQKNNCNNVFIYNNLRIFETERVINISNHRIRFYNEKIDKILWKGDWPVNIFFLLLFCSRKF